MSSIDAMLPGFYSELSKEALQLGPIAQMGRRLLETPTLQKGLAGAGRAAETGGVMGAGLGGAIGAAHGYSQAKEQGKSPVTGALRSGLSGGAKGLLAGAALGGGVSMVSPKSGLGLRQFAQRQVHGLTGWTPQGGIQAIEGGSMPARRHLETLGKNTKTTPAQLEKAKKWVDTAHKAEQMGMTSIPGYAKSLATKPLDTLRTGAAEQWYSMGPTMRGLAFGLPAAQIGHEAITPSEPGGPTKAERLGSHLGDIVMATAPISLAGQLAAMPTASAVGRRVGRLISKRTPPEHVPAPPTLSPAGGAAAPAEVTASDRALGMVGSQV